MAEIGIIVQKLWGYGRKCFPESLKKIISLVQR